APRRTSECLNLNLLKDDVRDETCALGALASHSGPSRLLVFLRPMYRPHACLTSTCRRQPSCVRGLLGVVVVAARHYGLGKRRLAQREELNQAFDVSLRGRSAEADEAHALTRQRIGVRGRDLRLRGPRAASCGTAV